MTFEEWLEYYNIYCNEIGKENLEVAFKAGRKSLKDELIGETPGDWVEVHRDTLCEMVGEYNDF